MIEYSLRGFPLCRVPKEQKHFQRQFSVLCTPQTIPSAFTDDAQKYQEQNSEFVVPLIYWRIWGVGIVLQNNNASNKKSIYYESTHTPQPILKEFQSVMDKVT